MSFKKTQDGRVFFKNQPGSANDRGDSARRAVKSKPVVSDSNISTAQILGLLKSLNEKLVKTQAERKTMRAELAKYRGVVESLQNSGGGNASIKADRAERTAQDLLKELAEARRLMAQIENKADRADQNATSLKAHILEARQGQKLLATRQDEFDQKLDDTQVQQTRVMRQIDKAVEDRSRFMRKIERIEEAVLQTQDALNAKAMVLLTDQGVAGNDVPLDMNEDGSIIPQKRDQAAAAQPVKSATTFRPLTWWNKLRNNKFLLGTLIGVGFLAVGAGLVSNRPAEQVSNAVRAPYVPTADAPVRVADVGTQTPPSTQNFQAVPWQAPQEIAPSETDAFGVQTYLGEAIDLQNEAQVLDLMDTNPDALATELNKIEPSTVPENVTLATVTPEPVAAPTPAPVKEAPKAIAPPVKTTNTNTRLPKPDRGLPDEIKKIEAEALGGSPEAQHDLAAIYTAGHGGVKQDYKRAATWFAAAANSGIANASYNLGVLHHQGLGVKKDTNEAISWYQKAAEQGHPEAQYNLGIAHIEGIGVPYDAPKASGYFKNAADQGVMEAAYNLGLIYENGLLGAAEPDKALMWYKIAADQGGPEAKQALEQLAKTLKIDLKDVNKIADGMRDTAQKKTKKVTTPPAPVVAAPVVTPVAPNVQENPYVQAPAPDERAIIAQIQDYLIEIGLYPGPASGQVNPIMRDAIRVYQRDNELGTNGVADRELLVHMLGNEVYTGSGSGSRFE